MAGDTCHNSRGSCLGILGSFALAIHLLTSSRVCRPTKRQTHFRQNTAHNAPPITMPVNIFFAVFHVVV